MKVFARSHFHDRTSAVIAKLNLEIRPRRSFLFWDVPRNGTNLAVQPHRFHLIGCTDMKGRLLFYVVVLLEVLMREAVGASVTARADGTVVLSLSGAALGRSSLLDLEGRTIRFT